MNMRMNRNTLALAAIFLTLPLFGMAEVPANTAKAQAADMVSANAVLMHNLDAKKDHTGSAVRAKLNTTVQLTNGTKLDSGTVLTGHVVQDQMQPAGTSRLALDFNQAKLKDGKTVPIKATLVGVTPGGQNNVGYLVEFGNKWTNGPLQVDQIGVMPGIDLHSKIASNNSGVLVSTKKDNVKLRQGTGLQFAIGAANSGEAAAS